MGFTLPVVDLSSAVVGTTGLIDLKPAGYTSDPSFTNNQATLQLENESGSGLQITTLTGQTSVYIPAGGWKNISLAPGERGIQWTVIYQITNPSVTMLLATFYRPNEPIPAPATLGNSPVGGTVTSTGGGGTADHLINTTNAASSSAIINIEESGASGAQMFADNQGNFTISQYVAAVLTTIFRVIAGVAANNSNVLLSDANHQTEVLGRLLVDSFANFTGSVQGNAGGAGGGANSFYVNGLGNGGNAYTCVANAGDAAYTMFNALGGGTANTGIGFSASSNLKTAFDCHLINTGGTGLLLGANCNPGIDFTNIITGTQGMKFAGGGTITRMSIFSGSANNAFTMNNHGLGVVPDAVFFCEQQSTADTTTFLWDQSGSTTSQVRVYSSAGATARNFIAIAIAK